VFVSEEEIKEKLLGINESAAIITAAILSKYNVQSPEELITVSGNIFGRVKSQLCQQICPPK
jgi:hypothetical protein